MMRTAGSSSRAARHTAESRAKASSWSRGPSSPTFTYCTPQPAAPAAARAAMPGRLGTSPMAALTGISAGVISRTRRMHVREVGAQRALAGVLDVHDVRVSGDGGLDLVLADHADE